MTPHTLNTDPVHGRGRRATAWLSTLGALAFLALLHGWTHGFEVWTFEGRRQLAIESGRLRADPLVVVDSRGHLQTLWPGGTNPKAYLVDFIYTRCETVFSAQGNEFQQMQRALEASPAAAVRLVSISFDTAFDQVRQLEQYARLHGARTNRWSVVRAAQAEDTAALLLALQVVVVPDGQGGFVHNGEIQLLDQEGRLQGQFDYGEWPQALAAARQCAQQCEGQRP